MRKSKDLFCHGTFVDLNRTVREELLDVVMAKKDCRSKVNKCYSLSQKCTHELVIKILFDYIHL